MANFGHELKLRRKQRGMSLDNVADVSGLSKTYIANIENNKPHPQSGAPPKPSRKTVEALAMAVNWSIPEALLAAGYAPAPQEIREANLNDLPPELQTVFGLYGRVAKRLPPGKARDRYIEGLMAQAQSNLALLEAQDELEGE